jgi:hypothetical protein
MGKSISDQEYSKAVAQLDGCRDYTCLNNKQSNVPRDARDYCKVCKLANKVRREYERVRGRAA